MRSDSSPKFKWSEKPRNIFTRTLVKNVLTNYFRKEVNCTHIDPLSFMLQIISSAKIISTSHLLDMINIPLNIGDEPFFLRK